jgi:hypothetical protein
MHTSMPESGEKIEDHREDDAEEDGGSKRKEEGDVPSAPGEVTGQPSEGESEAGSKDQDRSPDQEKQAKSEKRFAEFGHEKSGRVSEPRLGRGIDHRQRPSKIEYLLCKCGAEIAALFLLREVHANRNVGRGSSLRPDRSA